ncbi:MAG: hypothetical protein KDI71_18760 [Xanthomonadales bacterium]|nr:hypothetical protein [Xanthomonadales bacterium]
MSRAASDPKGSGPWALWSLGILGARGLERQWIYTELLSASADPDPMVWRARMRSLGLLLPAEAIVQ